MSDGKRRKLQKCQITRTTLTSNVSGIDLWAILQMESATQALGAEVEHNKCNSFQTAVFSCHSSRAGSVDPGYHDVDDYDDEGNRRYDEGRFGVREDYAGDGYWSPAPTAPAERDLERNRYTHGCKNESREGLNHNSREQIFRACE